jgi:F-type H+-transporting ATPase subunit b
MHLLAFAEEVVQLFPDGSLFIHIAMVLAMIWILNRTLYRPINSVLEARERAKGGRSSEAEELLRDAEAKETQYQKEMLDARSAGYSLIEKEQKKAAADREKKVAAAKAAAADDLAAGRSDLEKHADEARAAIKTDAGKLADKIAANILKA